MVTLQDLEERVLSAEFVLEVDSVLRPIAQDPRNWEAVRHLLGVVVRDRLDALVGSNDEWFNFAVRASVVEHLTAERVIVERGLEHHPEDVDLLCQYLQFRYGHVSLRSAEETWAVLESLGRERTAPFWRYWVYGATLHGHHLHDRKRALALLDEGLHHVRPADQLNIYRHYRQVLLDGAPGAMDPDADPSLSTHKDLVDAIETRYKEGIDRGIESGYVLAVDIAKLLRERSAREDEEVASTTIGRAIGYLDVADRIYTNDPNHPVWDIYTERATTLMALRRYSDALRIFRSLPGYLMERQPSLETMARYASNMTGELYGRADAIAETDAGAQTSGESGAQQQGMVERLARFESNLQVLNQQMATFLQMAGVHGDD